MATKLISKSYKGRTLRQLQEHFKTCSGFMKNHLHGNELPKELESQSVDTLCTQLRQSLKYAEELRTLLYIEEGRGS